MDVSVPQVVEKAVSANVHELAAAEFAPHLEKLDNV